ncbi:hypothetical protein L227DRAFT_500037 [Lentinus tigrinus ALCF2SS1-6]|uniref:F-box domain-containing protein n=1 Tax=Lentinus tigrinus ALCF2SS1-6 TaxID=1328759 RepID=A0A5C2SD97_9APHY|nr:hypothetical protein L227DRAFT_500037 [Lentinus tigrinus ALCF2SS1-6]
MEQDLTHESLSLTPLVLRTHKTIESLRLMMESASLTRMGELTWPNLHEITFSGEFLTSSTTTGLPFAHLLQRTPRLRILSVKVALRYGSDRLSILGRTPQPWIKALKLRSLALSYPDPVDVIFCANMAALTHLSLCDSPRYHYHLAFTIVSNRYSAPILTSAECLSILKRMNMPALESLALSYIADEADDDLLRYVTEAFPRLHTLELHRYRKNRRDIVQHAHIAHLLSRAEMLRHVFLNLDFHDDHGPPGKGDWHEVVHSFDPIHNARGFELVTIMERCPGLKYVALLRHYELASKWVEYYPSRWAKSRYVIVPKWYAIPLTVLSRRLTFQQGFS